MSGGAAGSGEQGVAGAEATSAASKAERDVLVACLEYQRKHILDDLEGLDDEALHRRVLPSAWSCLGLIGHLTSDVEQFWFRCVVAGEHDTIEETMSAGDAWGVACDVTPDDVVARYREEIAKANAVIARLSLDAAPGWWPEGHFGNYRLRTVREVMLHVIVETATHAGQLDVVRESLTGGSGSWSRDAAGKSMLAVTA